MNPYNFSLLFFSFCTFLISILIWLKRQDAIGRSYFVFCLFVTMHGVALSLSLNNGTEYSAALFFARLANISATFIPSTWLNFTLIFTQNKSRFRRCLLFIYIVEFVIASFGFSRWFIPSLQPVHNFNYYARPGFVHAFFTLQFFIIVPVGFVFLVRHLNRQSYLERTQLKGLIAATLAGFVGGALTFFPIYNISIPQYGLFLMPIYPFVMAYFMIRHHLFDYEEIAQAFQKDKLSTIGILAASMNHEIRNPLYIIHGLSEGFLFKMRESPITNKEQLLLRAAEVMSKTLEQSERAMEIMKSFSLFAKQSVDDTIHIEPVSIGKVLESVLPLVRHELALEKIRLVCEVAPDLPAVSAVYNQMVQIFFNLIVNACQAMRDGGELTISAAVHEAGIRILIKDTGPGIAKERLQRIFQPFQTTKEAGTGLGLYITKLLVEKNHGRISIESAEGRGTAFVLEFLS
jgi:signal transduction histidine kinase